MAALALVLTLSACSESHIRINRQKERELLPTGAAFSTRNQTPGAFLNPKKKYLATVQIRFSEGTEPIRFDVHRDRRDAITATMMQTKETTTTLHLGHNSTEGGIFGLRFIWRY